MKILGNHVKCFLFFQLPEIRLPLFYKGSECFNIFGGTDQFCDSLDFRLSCFTQAAFMCEFHTAFDFTQGRNGPSGHLACFFKGFFKDQIIRENSPDHTEFKGGFEVRGLLRACPPGRGPPTRRTALGGARRASLHQEDKDPMKAERARRV